MSHEPRTGDESHQAHNDVRLFERVEAALNAPLPGWPPPDEIETSDDLVPDASPPSQNWRNDLGAPPAWVRAALAAPLPEGAPPDLLRVISGLRSRIGIDARLLEREDELWERACIQASEALRLRLAAPAVDNVSQELVDLARQGDEPSFRRLAVCVMPVEKIGECWAGARGRLGLPVAETQESE
ncbi:MAG: hypothetical protein Q8R92_08515 [Deltaproteobacteria bacterium]|nr:hypothetical protein [Deltaproteobacteria bacterium]